MISLKEIMKSINKQISNKLEIDVDSKNIEEEFERPSVRTSIDNLKTSAFMQTMKERNFIVRIYYFPRTLNKNKKELLEIQEKLEEAFFSHLKIKEAFFIYIDEIDKTIIIVKNSIEALKKLAIALGDMDVAVGQG